MSGMQLLAGEGRARDGGLGLLITLTAGLVLIATLAWQSVAHMYSDWMVREEYSHGILIPLLSGYLLWLRRDYLKRQPVHCWLGVLVLLGGALVAVVGRISTIHALSQYGVVMALIGLFYAAFGVRHWRQTVIPLCLLFFMVPLPHFLHQAASSQLQLLSSEIGVYLVRLFGISVYLEGNVIDLGSYKLQVLEACDGLRYLFPLSTLSFIFAYLYRGPLLHRVILFLSAVPITVLMNSFRIAMIGILVEHYGTSMAEGFLHDFQGWTIFLVSVVVLLALAKTLALASKNHTPLATLLAPERESPEDVESKGGGEGQFDARWPRIAFAPVTFALALLGITSVLGHQVMARIQDGSGQTLPREDFLTFPMTFQPSWLGTRRSLEAHYLEELKLDDYLLADYTTGSSDLVNVYIAYYDDQASGRSVHSPRTCLPGGGWEMQRFDTVRLADHTGTTHTVNRVVIGKGLRKQLVYYWFEQRGKTLANEYAVKWHLFWDSLTTQRTDGALVRLIAPFHTPDDLHRAEQALAEVYRSVRSRIGIYVPGS